MRPRRHRRGASALVVLAALLAAGASAAELPSPLQWDELPALPDAHGFAGAFAGVSGDALILAGGANFPGGRPWEGHAKIWHDRVFVLDAPGGRWIELDARLPRAAAYGVSLAWRDALVCIGGGDATRHFHEVSALRWRDGALAIEPLPSLPAPRAFFCGALIGESLYVAGGLDTPDATRAQRSFWALDLAARSDERRWRELEPWPGEGRLLAVAGALGGSLYIFSGAALVEGDDGATRREYLRDAYRFTPGRGWTPLADMPRAAVAAPGPAPALGTMHLLVLGGDTGEHAFASPALEDAHPGFSDEVLAYNVVTDTWVGAGRLPREPGPDPVREPNAGVWPPVTATALRWDDLLVVPSGEVRPGVRTPRVLVATETRRDARFGAFNWVVLVVYLAALVALGAWFSRRERSADDFFLAGRRVPWWAAGLSIFATQLSAITYLAIPATSFATDWARFLLNMGIVAISPLVAFVYLPFFRRLPMTSAYEYLEARFGLGLRLFGALAFVVYQLGRMGVVVLLPALALSAVTGMDVFVSILLMGVLSTVYTVLGGIEAVIWTDVVQVVVLVGGALAVFAVVGGELPGGLGRVVGDGLALGKLDLVHLEWAWVGDALPVILLGAFFANIAPYTSDQAIVQRYLTTADEGRARRAIWTSAALVVPASVIFFGLGTALFVFYRARPELLSPLEQSDQILPWFIAQQMPAGLAGLVIAGVFAAAMSSLDSSMHSAATVISTDFVARLRPRGVGERGPSLALARWLTVALGALGTGAAVLLASADVRSLWTTFLGIVGLLLGTLGGLFALGIFTRRSRSAHAWVGVASSVAALLVCRFATDISGLLYAAVGVSTCFVAGAAASLVAPSRAAGDLTGLTVYSRARRPADVASAEDPQSKEIE